jgi:hypothetical protein
MSKNTFSGMCVFVRNLNFEQTSCVLCKCARGCVYFFKRVAVRSLILTRSTQMATLSTSVLNDPSSTTHDLLRLLWQSSPYSGILT